MLADRGRRGRPSRIRGFLINLWPFIDGRFFLATVAFPLAIGWFGFPCW